MTLLHFYSLFSLKHFTYDVKLDENELFCSFWVAEKETQPQGVFCISPLKRSVFGLHGIQTLKVVTSHPLSRTHLTSSEAKLDGWGWNEVCQTRQQSSHSKRIPLIKLILAIYYWLLLSSSVGSFASDTAAIDNGSRCKINDWAGKCLGIWLAKTLKCFWVHLISNAALCPLRGFIPTAASGLLYQFVEEGCCPDNRRIIFK